MLVAAKPRLVDPTVFKFSVVVAVVVRLKKWVKAVCKRVAFSTAFAHGCEAIFKLSINMISVVLRLLESAKKTPFENRHLYRGVAQSRIVQPCTL